MTMSNLPLTARRAREIVREILGRYDDSDLAEKLIVLIRGTCDPEGDQRAYGAANAAIIEAFTFTDECRKALSDYLGEKADEEQHEDAKDESDSPPS